MQSLCISMNCIGVLTKSQIPPIPGRGPPIRPRRITAAPPSTYPVREARCRPSPPLPRSPPSAQVGSTPTPMASARAASTAADRVVVPAVAVRRRRPAFFNAAPAGPRKAVCPPRRRSPPRAARARDPTRSASPGDPALRPRAGDPPRLLGSRGPASVLAGG